MLIETDPATIAAFVSRKTSQGRTAMAALPGVSMVTSGERGSSVALCWDGIETVIIGQLPHLVMRSSGSPRNPLRRDTPNGQKPHDRRGIDLTDDEVSAVIARWKAGQSALDLPFISHVYDEKGRPRS